MCDKNEIQILSIDHKILNDSANWNLSNANLKATNNGLEFTVSNANNSFVRDLNVDFTQANDRINLVFDFSASGPEPPLNFSVEFISGGAVVDSKIFEINDFETVAAPYEFTLATPKDLSNPQIRLSFINSLGSTLKLETFNVYDYKFCEIENTPVQTVLTDLIFNYDDAPNWLTNAGDLVVYETNYLKFEQLNAKSRFKRPLGLLPPGQTDFILSGTIGIKSEIAGTDRVYYQLIDETNNILFSDFRDVQSNGDQLILNDFDVNFRLQNSQSKNLSFVTFSQTSLNSVAMGRLTAISVLSASTKERVYFVDDTIFQDAKLAQSAKIELLDYDVDGLDVVTAQFYNDFASAFTNSNVYGEWAYCKADIDGQNPNNQDDPNTWNFFKKEFGLDYNNLNSYPRGTAIGYTSGNNYGNGLLDLGVNKPRVLDVNRQMLPGAWFVDIDFTKDFYLRFRVLLNKNSPYVYEGPEVFLIYTIIWTKQKCNFTFSKTGFFNGQSLNVDITNQGFLKGLTDPTTTENPQFDLTPYCSGNFPPLSDCVRKERTLSYAAGISIPQENEDLQALFNECKYIHRVLAEPNDPSDYKNDYTGFYHQRQLTSEICEFFLIKISDNTETELNTNDLGTFQDFGTMRNEALKTFVLEWVKVYSLLGPGAYKVEKRINLSGIVVVQSSIVFNLELYSREKADHSIRIDCLQNGFMDKTEVDFKDSNFIHSLRFPGFFGNRDPKLEEDNIIASDFSRVQVSMKSQNEYKMQSNLVPDCITDEVLDFFLLASNLWVNDYNLNNHSYDYKKKPVKLESNQGTEYKSHTRKARINLTFGDLKLNQNNRNY